MNGSQAASSKKSRLFFLVLVAILIVVGAIVGTVCMLNQLGRSDIADRPDSPTHPAQAGQPVKIVYAMPVTVAAIPAYVAMEKGYWKEEGLDVDAKMFSAGRLALDALLAGSAQVMSVSETPLMHAILQGNSIRIIATVTEHQEAKLVVLTSAVPSPHDLRGKRIATLPGTNSDYFMSKYLEHHGIPREAVKIVDMKPPEMVTAFVGGHIDGYFAWEPHIFYAVRQVGEKARVVEAAELYHGRHCVAMNADFVQESPQVVTKLLRGFIRAEEFVRAHQDEAIRIVMKRTDMDEESLRTLWSEYTVRVEFDKVLLNSLNSEGQWALKLRESKGDFPDFRKYLYTQALLEVRPESVKVD